MSEAPRPAGRPSSSTRGRRGGISQATLRRGLASAADVDPRVSRALARHGYPTVRGRDPGFAALLRAIVGQQISTGAARAIWGRMVERVGDDPGPEAVLGLPRDALRAIGLSERKAEYARDLAHRVHTGALPLDRLHRYDDARVVELLTAVRGLGRWSAEIYLLFALGRADVFPAGDLGLRAAMERLGMTRGRPDEGRAARRAARWAPWRGCVAILLWHTLNTPPLRAPGRVAQPAAGR